MPTTSIDFTPSQPGLLSKSQKARVSAQEGVPSPNASADNKFKVGPVSFEAFGDRILIQQDNFKSGYECKACGGTGKSALNPMWRCKECEGKGSLLVIPETAERKPTTGKIISTGPDVQYLKVGQSVMFSSYAGHTVDLNDGGIPVVMRVLHETEILCFVEGHLELRAVRDKSEIALSQG